MDVSTSKLSDSHRLTANSLRVVQAYPDSTTKILSGEKFTIYSEVELAGEEPFSDEEINDFINNFKFEIWTSVHCEEFHEKLNRDSEIFFEKKYFAAKLEFYKREGSILFFRRQLTPTLSGFYDYAIRYRFNNEGGWNWYCGDSYCDPKNHDVRKLINIYVEPKSVQNLIIYNAFVRHFSGNDRNGDGVIHPGEGGTFNDLIDKMNHFKRLNINAIYLNPIQKIGEEFRFQDKDLLAQFYMEETNVLPIHMHPGSVYSVKDYKSIDPEIGFNKNDGTTDQYHEFKRFVKECHNNGIKVFMDMVFDHTSRDSVIQRLHPEWFLYKKNHESLDDPYIYPEDDPQRKIWGEHEHVFSPFDHGIFWSDCAFINWNFRYPPSPNEARPNPAIKEMRKYFIDLLKYWVKNYGVDGFRLDVAYAIPPDFWHEAVEETRLFAKELLRQKDKSNNPDFTAPLDSEIIFIGETYVDDVYELQDCGLTCLNGDFSAKIFNVEQLKGYLDYAYNISGRYFPLGSRWMFFPECHDFYRLPKKFDGLLHKKDSDEKLSKSRWVLSTLLPGIPMLHNGFELLEHEQVSVRSYTPLNWNSERNIIDYIGKINKIKLDNVAFQKGDYTFVHSNQGVKHDSQIFSFIRSHVDEELNEKSIFLVVTNMDFNNKTDFPTIYIPHIEGYDFDSEYTLKDHLTGEVFKRTGYELIVQLEAGESHVFEIIQ